MFLGGSKLDGVLLSNSSSSSELCADSASCLELKALPCTRKLKVNNLIWEKQKTKDQHVIRIGKKKYGCFHHTQNNSMGVT
jgi:hypothetical protein